MIKQRNYHITNLDGTPTGKTIKCEPAKAARMSKLMGVRFMRHLPKTPTTQPTEQAIAA